MNSILNIVVEAGKNNNSEVNELNTQTTENKPLILSHLRDLAYRAHCGTSFSPERRADQYIKDYSEILEADIKFLYDNGATSDQIESYKSKYISMFSSWLSAKSRCISTMITGGSNFPVRRAEKANISEQNHYEAFNEWTKRAKIAITRKPKEEKTFVSEIDRLQQDLEQRKRTQQIMKDCNAIIKKAKGKDCTFELTVAGLSEKSAKQIQEPDCIGRIGFASFNLTNNLANIKRIESRINELKSKEVKAQTIGEVEHEFDGFKVIFNHTDDRLQVMHDSKPDASIISKLKSNGFKWSPKNMAWQRLLNRSSIMTTNMLFNINLPVNER